MILNTINGKCYIGSAVDLFNRWSSHKKSLFKGNHHSILLQRSWDKHGPDYFQFTIIEVIKDKNKLTETEQLWINSTKSFKPEFGYNIYSIAGSPLGTKRKPMSDETKKRISLAQIGLKRSNDFKIKMSIIAKNRSIHPFKNKHHKEETKNKIALSLTGYKHSQETRKKVSLAGKGRKRPDLKTNEWLHEKGSRCKCEECRQKRIIYQKNYRLASRQEVVF